MNQQLQLDPSRQLNLQPVTGHTATRMLQQIPVAVVTRQLLTPGAGL